MHAIFLRCTNVSQFPNFLYDLQILLFSFAPNLMHFSVRMDPSMQSYTQKSQTGTSFY